MAYTRLSILLILLGLVAGVRGIQWTDFMKDNLTLPVCPHQDISLAWDYTVASPNESVVNVEWRFKRDGRGRSEVVIATAVSGHFFADAGASARLEYISGAGIRLLNVETTDSGVYSVHVNTIRDGNVETHVKRMHLIVTDLPVTPDHQLHAQIQGARLMTSSQEHQLLLTCGDVADVWSSQVNVSWTTPSGDTLPSTLSNSGVYTLAVPNPLQGGQYTCKVDKSSPAARCLQSDSPLLGGDSVQVDPDQGRMMLMSSRLSTLKESVTLMVQDKGQLAGLITALEANSSYMQQQVLLLRAENEQLMNISQNIVSAPVKGSCNFNHDLCGYTQDHSGMDRFDWTRYSGITSSSGTGPNSQSGDMYMYTEASSRHNGDKALLYSPEDCASSRALCVLFAYHMYGSNTGTLNLKVKNETGLSTTPLFTKSYDQGDAWHTAKVTIPPSYLHSKYQLVFEGIIGDGIRSDMGIDNVTVSRGPCA